MVPDERSDQSGGSLDLSSLLLSEPEDSGGLDGLDLGDLGLSDEDEGFDGLGFTDGSEDDFIEDDLELGAELLFTESDISEVAFDYYNNLKAVQEKIQPPAVPAADNFKITTADFPYLDSGQLASLRTAILDQAKKQAALKESARMSPEDNAEEVFNVLSSVIPFNIGAYYNTFIDMCARKFENFLKLVAVSTAQTSTKFEQLLDKERMELSQFVFELNGLLWHQITIYLADERINRDAFINGKRSDGVSVYNCGVIGDAMAEYNEYLKADGIRPVEVGNMTVGNLLDCVNYMLSYQNMSAALHISPDDITTYRTGELLRRYILMERDDGILDLSAFKPSFKELNSVTAGTFERLNVKFSNNPQEYFQQISALYEFLRAPFYKEGRGALKARSVATTHELLYYIFLILSFGVADYKSNPRSCYEYLMLLTKYMISLMYDAPYVRPVVYFTPNPVPGESEEFDLNYYYREKYYSVREHGLLVNVVGDQRAAYLIPFVSAIDRDSRNVTCYDETDGRPSYPPCVVFPLHQLFIDLQEAIKSAGAASKKLKIDGTTEYRYIPSLAWVVSRSYSSQQDIDAAHSGEQHNSRTSHPLLRTLLAYTNKFEPERFPVTAGLMTTPQGLTAHYIEEKGDATSPGSMRLVNVLQGESFVSDKGTISVDDSDGALVMRYYLGEGNDEEGKTIVLERDQFALQAFVSSVEQAKAMPPVGSYVQLGTDRPTSYEVFPELRSINKRLCVLNALEYEEELESVRLVIMRDLKNVAVTYHMDTLLAYGLLIEYAGLIKPGDDVDPVNFESLRALIHIVMGPVPELDEKSQWDESCREYLLSAIAASKIGVGDLCIYLDQFDVNVMALQGLSNSETSNIVDRTRYMALHALPGVHARLRNLEERMLLLRVLNEIGSDIAPILRKKSPMLTAYNDITTADTLDEVEASLKSGMKGGKKFDAFPLTRSVLSAEVGGSTPILKYFALERNVHGILATAAYSDDPQEKEIYEKLYGSLGLGAEGMPQILKMDERAFMNAPFAISLETACSSNRGLLLKLIERGLLADTSARVDLHVIKAFDLLISYGVHLFDLKGNNLENQYAEDFDDVSEYMDFFYSYVGSFLVSYCFLQDEAVTGEASNADRVVTFRESPSGFVHSADMSRFASYDLVDMRTVISE